MSKYYEFPCFPNVTDAAKAAEAYSFMQKHRDLFKALPEQDVPQHKIPKPQSRQRYLAEEYSFFSTDESNV